MRRCWVEATAHGKPLVRRKQFEQLAKDANLGVERRVFSTIFANGNDFVEIVDTGEIYRNDPSEFPRRLPSLNAAAMYLGLIPGDWWK